MPINKNPRMVRKRDLPGDLEGRVGGGTPVGRATGGGRTTRTGTPRTSTNTKPPAKRTSPGQRIKTKNYSTGAYMPGEDGLKKREQRKGIQVSSVNSLRDKPLSPKQSRKVMKSATVMAQKLNKKIYRSAQRDIQRGYPPFSISPKDSKSEIKSVVKREATGYAKTKAAYKSRSRGFWDSPLPVFKSERKARVRKVGKF